MELMEIGGHRKGEFGIGASKAQHFIQHLRDATPETYPETWRDEQEKWAEAAQLAVCEELSCNVCNNTCKVFTEHHWDTNRILHGDEPKYESSYGMHKIMCTNPDILKGFRMEE